MTSATFIDTPSGDGTSSSHANRRVCLIDINPFKIAEPNRHDRDAARYRVTRRPAGHAISMIAHDSDIAPHQADPNQDRLCDAIHIPVIGLVFSRAGFGIAGMITSSVGTSMTTAQDLEGKR
jgi:hypothetical protein